MKIIYTAIFGDYEELKDPLVVTNGWRYICYTDRPLVSKVWEVIRCKPDDDATRQCRYIKILAGPQGRMNDYGVKTIWVDGSFTINCDLNDFWEKNFVSPFTVVQHPMRNCVYSEFTACIDNKRADYKSLYDQRLMFLKNKVPVNNGVIQSGILLRENTEEVREFCDLWWEQIKYSTRDQIGFAWAEWKLGKKWPRIEMDYRRSQDFIFKTHYHRRKKLV